jgi:hypothetical protein
VAIDGSDASVGVQNDIQQARQTTKSWQEGRTYNRVDGKGGEGGRDCYISTS